MTLPFEVPAESVLRERGSAKWTAFPDAIGAFVAEMDFGVAPVIRAAIDAELDAARTGYLPSAASTALAEATAAWSADRYDWPIRPDQVRPVADVLTGLDLVLRRYSDPSKPVIVPTPAYMPFLQIPQRHGREIIEVPSLQVDGRYELDLDGIAKAFEAGADVLVLCNPWNPVGRVLTREELVAVSEVVDRFGGRVFADEIHAPVVFPGQRHVPYASVSEAAAGHTVTAISASKAFNLPGLKCAQLVLSNDADAERYEQVAGLVAHGAAGFGVAANTAAYTQGGPWLDGVLEYLDASRTRVGELLAERLPQVGYRAPEGSYIAWLDVRALDLGDAPAEGRGFVRLILATPQPVLEEIVDRLARAFG
jgi:cystathionine beta-lyase